MTTLTTSPSKVGILILSMVLGLSLFMCTSCGDGFEAAPTSVCKAIAELPYDPANFTQGFLVADGHFYAGTGQRGASRLIRIDMKTGKTIKEAKLANQLFGEGIVVHDGMIYQLTWKSQKCVAFDLKNMIRRNKQFTYRGEGWGITSNGKEFFMSNGTHEIVVRNPEDFKEVRRFSVTESTESIRELNELEYINGELWANIWQQDRIARIDPETGKIKSWVDCKSLRDKLENPDAGVLNGIAYDPIGKKIWVTGKNWDKMFQIEVD
ncbi:MAG: glutamine cyclotransferase [Planctomycetota bacterium]|jgi:glutamine cyclotransferase